MYSPFFQKNCNLDSLQKVFQHIDTTQNDEKLFSICNITELVDFIILKKKCFKKFQQNDAHEFLIEFLDILVNTIHGQHTTGCNTPWDRFLKQNNYSPFVKEYHGQSKLDIQCLSCKNTTRTFEEFNTINLDIPIKNSDVTTLFINYLKKEKNNDTDNLYYCDQCKGNHASERKITLTILPNTLIIVLKRYTETGAKLLSDVEYDQTLHIKDHNSIKKYTLTGIVHHFGNLYDGHYTSSVKINDTWYSIDDSSISEETEQDRSTAYILFYSV
jgi:ubiquitin carboxyl-terminal hydrolase 8